MLLYSKFTLFVNGLLNSGFIFILKSLNVCFKMLSVENFEPLMRMRHLFLLASKHFYAFGRKVETEEQFISSQTPLFVVLFSLLPIILSPFSSMDVL